MGADQGPQKVVIELERELHEAVRALAAHYGASIRGTLVRYAREGVERDQKALQDAARKAPDDTLRA